MESESLNLNHAPDNCGALSITGNGEVLTLASLARKAGIEPDWLYTVILCGASVRGIRYDFVRVPLDGQGRKVVPA